MTEFTQPSPGELKQQVYDLIRRHPDRHDQGTWVGSAFTGKFGTAAVSKIRARLRRRKSVPATQQSPDGLCGTTACVAGWGAILGSPPGAVIVVQGWDAWEASIRYPDGTEKYIAEAAAELMELDDDQAEWLFRSDRSRTEVLAGLRLLIEHPDTLKDELEALEEDE
jgi:hypothetical protein